MLGGMIITNHQGIQMYKKTNSTEQQGHQEAYLLPLPPPCKASGNKQTIWEGCSSRIDGRSNPTFLRRQPFPKFITAQHPHRKAERIDQKANRLKLGYKPEVGNRQNGIYKSLKLYIRPPNDTPLSLFPSPEQGRTQRSHV